MTKTCNKCGGEHHYALERCPHCAYPGLYPNVLIASQPDERAAVDRRYDLAMRDASRRGCKDAFTDFVSWLGGSMAVVARSFQDVERLATSESSVQATFYDLTNAGLTLPSGSYWDQIRRPADEILFPHYREKVRFGALSCDGIGVANFGDFSMTMRSALIEDRASTFDQNSVKLVRRRILESASSALRGHRAPWLDRTKLAAAQLGKFVSQSTKPCDFPSILIKNGVTTEHDSYIEVNIWGSFTVRTIEVVKFSKNSVKIPRSLLKQLKHRLKSSHVEMEEIS